MTTIIERAPGQGGTASVNKYSLSTTTCTHEWDSHA